MKELLRNRIRCKKCGDILESTAQHEFKTCHCGAVSIDGGLEYTRRCGEPADYEDLNEFKEEDNSK